MAWSRSPYFDAVMAGAWLALGCLPAYAVRGGKASPSLLLVPALFGTMHALKLLPKLLGRWHAHRAKGRAPRP
jgi:hypothetical protein